MEKKEEVKAWYNTQLGWIQICSMDGVLTSMHFIKEKEVEGEGERTLLTDEAYRQLEAYFMGQRKKFTLPLKLLGTPFQQKVWKALCTIPYGETRSYKQIAELINQPKAARAIGSANHNNPIAVIVPCHRVIGANGSLTGYAGGLLLKTLLLKLEQENK